MYREIKSWIVLSLWVHVKRPKTQYEASSWRTSEASQSSLSVERCGKDCTSPAPQKMWGHGPGSSLSPSIEWDGYRGTLSHLLKDGPAASPPAHHREKGDTWAPETWHLLELPVEQYLFLPLIAWSTIQPFTPYRSTLALCPPILTIQVNCFINLLERPLFLKVGVE